MKIILFAATAFLASGHIGEVETETEILMVLEPLPFALVPDPDFNVVSLRKEESSWKKVRRRKPVKTASGVVIEPHRSGRTKVWRQRIETPVRYPLMMGGT